MKLIGPSDPRDRRFSTRSEYKIDMQATRSPMRGQSGHHPRPCWLYKTMHDYCMTILGPGQSSAHLCIICR